MLIGGVDFWTGRAIGVPGIQAHYTLLPRSRSHPCYCATCGTVHARARKPTDRRYRYHVVTHCTVATMYRFQVGDTCFVRRLSEEKPLTVKDRFIHDSGVPHYIVSVPYRGLHRVSQLQMSSKPIKLKK